MEGRGSAAGHLAVVAMLLVLFIVPGALAANHLVGGTQKWDYPPAGNNITWYTTSWAANQTFAVGDTLQFEYTPQQHNVVQFNTAAEYDSCQGTAVKTYETGNDTVPLPTAGTYYFICSIPGHCTQGMKVSVTIAAVSPASPPTATPPSTNPSPPTTPSPPPPGNGASSGPALSMAGLLIAAMVVSLAFLV